MDALSGVAASHPPPGSPSAAQSRAITPQRRTFSWGLPRPLRRAVSSDACACYPSCAERVPIELPVAQAPSGGAVVSSRAAAVSPAVARRCEMATQASLMVDSACQASAAEPPADNVLYAAMHDAAELRAAALDEAAAVAAAEPGAGQPTPSPAELPPPPTTPPQPTLPRLPYTAPEDSPAAIARRWEARDDPAGNSSPSTCAAQSEHAQATSERLASAVMAMRQSRLQLSEVERARRRRAAATAGDATGGPQATSLSSTKGTAAVPTPPQLASPHSSRGATSALNLNFSPPAFSRLGRARQEQALVRAAAQRAEDGGRRQASPTAPWSAPARQETLRATLERLRLQQSLQASDATSPADSSTHAPRSRGLARSGSRARVHNVDGDQTDHPESYAGPRRSQPRSLRFS